jgi:UDP-N-acetylglucosamine 2-epimerase (non-hydrolysing)
MSKPMKLLTVLGTRPEMIRLSKLIQHLDADSRFQHVYVHTGQNDHPQLRDVFYQDLNLRLPNYRFESRKSTRLKTIQEMKVRIAEVIEKEKPQAFLVLGDTDSALTAEVAKTMNVPIFHMEAGNRCFDRRSPEEANRKLIDRLSDFNLPYSTYGEINLIKENINQPIFITGSPLREVLSPLLNQIKDHQVLNHYQLKAKKYFVWSTHRAEHIDDDRVFQKLIQTLTALATHYPMMKILVTTHPRFQKKLAIIQPTFPKNVEFHPPFGLIDYLSLQMHSYAVLSDSGSIHEEADILGFHAVHLRRRHERQEAEVIPVTYLSEFKTKNILSYLDKLSGQPKKQRVKAYQEKNFSTKVAQYIFGRLLEVYPQKD